MLRNHLLRQVNVGRGPVITVHEDNGVASAQPGQTTHNYPTLNIGPASANRYVVISTTLSTSNARRKPVSATINGVAATIVGPSSINWVTSHIIVALVPTGTTCTASVTYDGTVDGQERFRVYTVTNATLATGGANINNAASVNQEVNTYENGCLFAVGNSETGPTAAYTWTAPVAGDSIVSSARFEGVVVQDWAYIPLTSQTLSGASSVLNMNRGVSCTYGSMSTLAFSAAE